MFKSLKETLPYEYRKCEMECINEDFSREFFKLIPCQKQCEETKVWNLPPHFDHLLSDSLTCNEKYVPSITAFQNQNSTHIEQCFTNPNLTSNVTLRQ